MRRRGDEETRWRGDEATKMERTLIHVNYDAARETMRPGRARMVFRGGHHCMSRGWWTIREMTNNLRNDGQSGKWWTIREMTDNPISDGQSEKLWTIREMLDNPRNGIDKTFCRITAAANNCECLPSHSIRHSPPSTLWIGQIICVNNLSIDVYTFQTESYYIPISQIIYE